MRSVGADSHHPLAPSSERRGIGVLTPLLAKEGVGRGCCKELARTPHQEPEEPRGAEPWVGLSRILIPGFS